MILAMIPGDARQEALADLLRADGHKTPVYSPGLEADWFIFPLPTAAHPLLGTLRPGSRVLAGGAAGRWPDLYLRDYYDSEAVQVLNAAITAEGAIGEAIRASDRTLWDSDVLILGYGRIGRALASRLRGLGCRVTVCARREESRAEARAEGCRVLDEPGEGMGFDYLFNTVPEPILDRAPKGTVCLELASKPGGFRDLRGVLPCPGLPGKTAPFTAARVLKASIDRILKEENQL
ncbi:MAG: NAD-binding protein [Oscillospiraceae bacterium]|nr:NAD-binding protein [Oscillospiraceae bacterium]